MIVHVKKAALVSTQILLLVFSIHAQTPCEKGMAGEFPCQNINLLSRLTPEDLLAEDYKGRFLSDLWGWTDPSSGKEYVIACLANGTAFVDISDPVNPVILGILPDREEEQAPGEIQPMHLEETDKTYLAADVKVYENYAYIVSQGWGAGLQVFDLTNLRDVDVKNGPVVFEDLYYNELTQAHNIYINEETGFAYLAAGVSQEGCSSYGLNILNLQDPANPVHEACYGDNDSYVHDTQCVIYRGPDARYYGKEICFNSNKTNLEILDVTNKDEITSLSTSTYESLAYVHQGWLTDDHSYFLINDEQDEWKDDEGNVIHEIEDRDQPRTIIMDITNLEQPKYVAAYEHNVKNTDHNLFVVGNQVFESNYSSGLRVLDLTELANGELREKAYFDTFPFEDGPGFNGTWSNYPYFASGVIAVSDMQSGLFLLQMDYTTAYVVKQPKDIHAKVGDHLNMGIEVGGENPNLNWQYDLGSGFVDIDNIVDYVRMDTDSLHIHAVTMDQDQLRYRCKITIGENWPVYSEPATLYVTGDSIDDSVQTVKIMKQPQSMEVCVGDHFNIEIEAAGDNISYQWQYDLGAGFVDIDNHVDYAGTTTNLLHFHTVRISQDNRTYRCKVTAEGSEPTYSQIATLNVTNAPVANFEFETVNKWIVFEDYSNDAETYEWDFNDGSDFNSEISPTHYYDEANTYAVTLAVSNYCGTDFIEHDVTVSDVVVLNHPEDISVCKDGEASFTSAIFGNQLSYQWQYDTGNGFEDITEGKHYIGLNDAELKIMNAGADMDETDFRCKISHGAQFGQEETIYSENATLYVADMPTADFDFTIFGGELVLENNSFGADAFSWSFGDGEKSNEESPNHLYLENSTNTIVLEVSNACGTSSIQKEVDVYITSVEDQDKDDIFIYPNPASAYISIQGDANSTGYCYSLYTILGSEVLRGEGNSIYVGDLDRGIYMIDITKNSSRLKRIKVAIE